MKATFTRLPVADYRVTHLCPVGLFNFLAQLRPTLFGAQTWMVSLS
jgi:hypothetical protein